MGVYGRILFAYGGGIVLFVFVIFFDIATYIMKNSQSRYKTPTAIILSVYPVSDKHHWYEGKCLIRILLFPRDKKGCFETDDL